MRKSRTSSKRRNSRTSFPSSLSAIGFFVHDLVLYLYQDGLTKFNEVYIQRIDSTRTPQVVGGLLDVDCDETTIKGLLAYVTGNFPIDELVREVGQKNRLTLILSWLEPRIQSDSQNSTVFSGMANIYIDSNSKPETFLHQNKVSKLNMSGNYY